MFPYVTTTTAGVVLILQILLAFKGLRRMRRLPPDVRLARGCAAILETVRLERLWTESGPTAEARALRETGGSSLTPRERALLLAAWAFWDGSGGVTLAEVISHMDFERAELVCFLVMCAVPHAPS